MNYFNWDLNEPNNCCSGEDGLIGWWGGSSTGGWNDLFDNSSFTGGILVEYSGTEPGAVPLPAGPLLLETGLAGWVWPGAVIPPEPLLAINTGRAAWNSLLRGFFVPDRTWRASLQKRQVRALLISYNPLFGTLAITGRYIRIPHTNSGNFSVKYDPKALFCLALGKLAVIQPKRGCFAPERSRRQEQARRSRRGSQRAYGRQMPGWGDEKSVGPDHRGR